MNKDLSTYDWKDVQAWLQRNNMEKYIENFTSFGVNGYDLCYLANEDFAEMGITCFHDKNVILRNIRTMTLEELKLTMQYEGRRVTVQLDFEPSFTVEMLSISLCELFHISSKVYLATVEGEVLMPNIKIVELILLNPLKYKQLRIITEKDGIYLQSTRSMPKDYSAMRPEEPLSKAYEEKSKGQGSALGLENEYQTKEMKDRYLQYDVSKKFEKNDIEKEYLLYKESKASSATTQSGSHLRDRDQSQYSKEPFAGQGKSEQYKMYQEKESHRSYTPMDMQRLNGTSNEKEQLGGYYPNESTPKLSNKIEQSNVDQCGCNNTSEPYKYSKSSKVNANDNFRLPLPLEDIKKEASYSNYNNPSAYQPGKYSEDNKKFSSEKRSFRGSDPNENDNELLAKPLEKYSSYNERQQVEEQFIRKPIKDIHDEPLPNSQKRFDSKTKARGGPYEYEPASKGGLRGKGGFNYGERERK